MLLSVAWRPQLCSERAGAHSPSHRAVAAGMKVFTLGSPSAFCFMDDVELNWKRTSPWLLCDGSDGFLAGLPTLPFVPDGSRSSALLVVFVSV